MRSCINYNTFRKLNEQLTQCEVPKVIGADGGDLGSMGIVQLTLGIGTSKVTQDFIVCRELRRNIILGVDFAKRNCAGSSGPRTEQGCCHYTESRLWKSKKTNWGFPLQHRITSKSHHDTMQFLKSTSMRKQRGCR